MERKDFLLLVVAAGKSQPLTPVQLQKSLFLIERANLCEAPKLFYQFQPYHYGPYDASIYSDADILQSELLVVRVPSSKGSWMETVISEAGLSRSSIFEESMSDSSVQYLHSVVEWVQSQSFSGLLRAIYNMYPEFRENSVFQG